MDEVKIIWTNIAIAQRNKVFDYWNDRNKSTTYSKKINIAIYEKIDILKTNPLAGNCGDLKPFRILYLGNFSLVYRYSESVIYIIAFWDNRQNPSKLKKTLGL
ncbi:hypothetical protein CHRY9390_00140 [Chryseobacterium aquaeductus]|uniref:Type II toxin-antitoxin system RelE/ParE family toxin n=1 Tax=Chryseobacterium aquaeductus TaxID=2675056 RepID=A0A9N8QQR2_9FLAO|nr:type II toxin-antitoxin system RelE/ParE family toxin [Chryseobacterium aquaeductus]CAA7329502.1 hypothetical protein CHRY9390_00140 [Chryseobacterium potabilaquae]CAD7797272.1 hypothetical protein CHRY9390_00140 [Chryseobacterium aquaeductus]